MNTTNRLEALKKYRPRPRRRLAAPFLHCAAIALFLMLLSPLLTIVIASVFSINQDTFLTLSTIASYCQDTLVYVGGTVLVSLLIALPLGWLTVVCEFRGRSFATWMLIAPFALPPYITAYTYSDIGYGWGISLYGMDAAIFTTSLALYPYIFFMVRSALRQQQCHIQSAARLLSKSRWMIFWRITLPIARPTIIIGVILVVMESLNDIAIAEYFGIQTIGVAIYDLWLNRGDTTGAIRLALIIMVIVFFVLRAEEHGRRKQAQYTAACDRCFECERGHRLTTFQQLGAWLLIGGISIMGFWLPVTHLITLTIQTPINNHLLLDAMLGSLWLCLLIIIGSVVLSIILGMEKRTNKKVGITRYLAQLARVMYALPGLVIAQGIFLLIGLSGAVIAINSFVALGLACLSRFYIIVAGNFESGMNKIPPHIDAVTQMAAMRGFKKFFYVYFPMLRSALALSTILIFLETLKELSMTLTLRPLNFNTLPLVVYQYASDESLDLAAPAALLLIGLALIAISILFYLEGSDARQKSSSRKISNY